MKLKVKAALQFVLVGLLAISCSESKSENTTSVAVNDDQFRAYPIDVGNKLTALADIIENVEIMALEETEEAKLNDILSFERGDDGKLFFTTARKGEVLTYTQDGKFINEFSHKGSSLKEYQFIQSSWTNSDSISIYFNKRLVTYNIEGEEIDRINLPFKPTHLFPYQDGYVANMNYYPYQDSLFYNVLFMDKEFNVEAMANPNTGLLRVPMLLSINSFKPYKEDLTYHSVLSDTIFYLKDKGSKTIAQIDFGKDWFWNGEGVTMDDPSMMSRIREEGLVWAMNPFVNDELIYLNYYTSLTNHSQLVLNRRTRGYEILDLKMEDDQQYSLAPLAWEGDRMLFSLQPEDLPQLLTDLGKERYKLHDGTSLEGIKSSQNPVLLWVKFKEF
ncbi:6-bladed beta-propeller [Roseivirga sp.]|uniref:6-bladed beta-propeller n=1 Tax=Roseivirga sp. TaxID=1964215 RepID=UPI002B27B6B4|nr:6-bladed beta-propeller [Roseivirga sp.]